MGRRRPRRMMGRRWWLGWRIDVLDRRGRDGDVVGVRFVIRYIQGDGVIAAVDSDRIRLPLARAAEIQCVGALDALVKGRDAKAATARTVHSRGGGHCRGIGAGVAGIVAGHDDDREIIRARVAPPR